jgi:hypothetical protein
LTTVQRARFGRTGFALACLVLSALALLAAPAAHAARLQVAPDAPQWMHVGADLLLWLHIGGGGIGIVTGLAALANRKGGRIHRSAGKVFFWAMLVSYGVAAAVAPFMHVEQRTNTFAGLIALYLLLSGWASVRHAELKTGPVVIAGLAAALGIAGAGAFFVATGAGMTVGAAAERPDPVFYAFAAVGVIAALGEINVLARGKISGPARLARHLWRMCLSLFVASGSFFLGQMQFLPGWLTGPRLNIVLALTPLVAMLVYLVLVRVPRRRPKVQPVSMGAGGSA